MVSIKHKVTIKTKTAQEETSVPVESPVVTLKRKQPEAAPVAKIPTVTLEKKHTKVAPETKSEVKPDSITITPPTHESKKQTNTGKIVGGIAAVAAILAGVYFFGVKGDDNGVDNGRVLTEQIAQTGETVQPKDAQQADSDEDATPGEDAAANNESETPACAEVNETLSSDGNSNSSTSVSDDVVEKAKRVIRGDFGNGQERKDKLGASYAEIQNKVNEMYRRGEVQ